MNWNLREVENFLGIKASIDGSAYVFTLPYPGEPIDVCVYPDEKRVQIFNRAFLYQDENREALSAYVHCEKIEVNYDSPDEGGNCITLSGNGGHACISPQGDYFAFFFCMHGKR